MPHFSRLLFFKKNQRHMHSICVWDMIKQSKPLQKRYDTTYMCARYYIRTHVYVFLFSVKKRVFEISRVWPWRWTRGGTPHMVFIGPIFHNTIKTCLRRVGHCGYEWVEKVSLQRTWASQRTVYKYVCINGSGTYPCTLLSKWF